MKFSASFKFEVDLGAIGQLTQTSRTAVAATTAVRKFPAEFSP